VARFQSEQKLTSDGIVGPGTWAALNKAVKGKTK
jgi:peptidoglycan hydrolase-like protein with peptidoglycan-binding domain